MCRITTNFDTLTIASSLTLEDIKRVSKLQPEALQLKDKEGTHFAVAVGDTPSLSTYGITFSNAAPEGKAIISFANVKTERQDIIDNFGHAAMQLSKVEAQVRECLDTINTTLDSIIE